MIKLTLVPVLDELLKLLIERVAHMVQRSGYKRRQAPPLIRLRAGAFGQGRQMPIAAVFPGVLS